MAAQRNTERISGDLPSYAPGLRLGPPVNTGLAKEPPDPVRAHSVGSKWSEYFSLVTRSVLLVQQLFRTFFRVFAGILWIIVTDPLFKVSDWKDQCPQN